MCQRIGLVGQLRDVEPAPPSIEHRFGPATRAEDHPVRRQHRETRVSRRHDQGQQPIGGRLLLGVRHRRLVAVVAVGDIDREG
jgi:hypothetical protein